MFQRQRLNDVSMKFMNFNIILRFHSTYRGYIGDEQATSAMMDDQGYLHTGDIGYYDDDLQFFIVDRIKELIKWKGFQVPPAGLRFCPM